jgi:hypothetical protein
MTDTDKMSIVSDSSVSSSMSLESSSNSLKMEIEDMLLATQGIISVLDSTEKRLADLQKNIVVQNSQPTYTIISPTDSKTNLHDALDILQSTSDASTFGSNMLKFLQNAKNIIIG